VKHYRIEHWEVRGAQVLHRSTLLGQWPADTPQEAAEAFLEELLHDEDVELGDVVDVAVADHGVFSYRVTFKLESLTPPSSWERLLEE